MVDEDTPAVGKVEKSVEELENEADEGNEAEKETLESDQTDSGAVAKAEDDKKDAEFDAVQRDIFGGDSDESSDEEAGDAAAKSPSKKDRADSSDNDDDDGDFDGAKKGSDGGDSDSSDDDATARLRNIQVQSRKRKRAQAKGEEDDDEDNEVNPKKRVRRTGRKRKAKALVEDESALPQEKKKKGGRSKEEIQEMVEEVMAQMTIAMTEDKQAVADGQPALSKMRLFPAAAQQIMHGELQRAFVNNGVLALLRQWIEPLPDKSLPNTSLREQVLELLHKISMKFVDNGVLKASGIGRIVQYYAKHPRETAKNKKLASALLDKWLRQVYRLTDKYSDIEFQGRRPSPNVQRKRPAVAAGDIKGGTFSKKASRLTSNADEMRKVGNFILYPEADLDFRAAPRSDAQPRETMVNRKHMAIKNRLGGMRRGTGKAASASYERLLKK